LTFKGDVNGPIERLKVMLNDKKYRENILSYLVKHGELKGKVIEKVGSKEKFDEVFPPFIRGSI
jgi:hypothetical protein